MSLVPVVKCTRIERSLAFYTGVLDFQLVGVWPDAIDPAYAILTRQGQELHLSSHAGDGVVGQHLIVLTPDVDADFAAALARGLDRSAMPDSPIHQGPVDQTWGTREAAVNDPDGNTLIFTQRPNAKDT
jgi:catechol 2,3-dioxygenase-like lactoylglutathione lyase family enzyme